MQEIDQVMHAASSWRQRCVLATVIRTEGSSYRKPGATMLVGEDRSTVGAVSGGCIEKEIVRRSSAVFSSGEAELIEYDGRYTLGCNGTLYILIEPFSPADSERLFQQYQRAFDKREPWTLVSRFDRGYHGSVVVFPDNTAFALRGAETSSEIVNNAIVLAGKGCDIDSLPLNTLVSYFQPSIRLFIIGSEIDAIKLAKIANEAGYIVTLVLHPQNNEVVVDSLGVSVVTASPENLAEIVHADPKTALILTTHSYSRDLGYLKSVCQMDSLLYLGAVGPKERADDLLSDLIEQGIDLPDWFDQVFNAPVGLDLGGQFPAEIAISILAELQLVLTGHAGGRLSDKNAGIHTVTQWASI